MIPFCADVLNKFRVGSDGRTAYERIIAHKCEVAQVGFCEVVDFKLETDKNHRHKADTEFSEGVFLGLAWRSTEYLVAAGDRCTCTVLLVVNDPFSDACSRFVFRAPSDSSDAHKPYSRAPEKQKQKQ